jgi:hypothetical protein
VEDVRRRRVRARAVDIQSRAQRARLKMTVQWLARFSSAEAEAARPQASLREDAGARRNESIMEPDDPNRRSWGSIRDASRGRHGRHGFQSESPMIALWRLQRSQGNGGPIVYVHRELRIGN